MEVASYALKKDEVEQFFDQGYLGPFTLCSPEEMADIRERVEGEVNAAKSPTDNIYQCRHLDCKAVYDLCTHSAVLDRAASLLGNDLILWRSHFFVKEPGGKEIPWHQDTNYWPIEPPVNLSAWIAIDEARIENSCVQLIPGSHRKVVPHVKSDGTKAKEFQEEAGMEYVQVQRAVPMELKPGQFFIFTERTLHYSAPNTSSKRRMGLVARITVPFVKVYHDQLFKGHKVVVIRGEDKMGLNQAASPLR